MLPLTAAFVDSWQPTRCMIERGFKDITAIVVDAVQALGQDALSADTGIEEMLLFYEKRNTNDDDTPAPIHCITLKKPVLRAGESREVVREILLTPENLDENRVRRPVIVSWATRIDLKQTGTARLGAA